MSGLLWFLLGVFCGAAGLIGWFALAVWLEEPTHARRAGPCG